MRLHTATSEYEFQPVALEFEEGSYSERFKDKNNKTVRETLVGRHYQKLEADVLQRYAHALDESLGQFLIRLKRQGDPFYRRFLNQFGDEEYSTFRIVNEAFLDKKGVYAYTVADALKYIGRCRDAMKKRVNNGYGKISPKNCYLDGRATNCRVNAAITQNRDRVRLWFCELELDKINAAEKDLIRQYQPAWNRQR